VVVDILVAAVEHAVEERVVDVLGPHGGLPDSSTRRNLRAADATWRDFDHRTHGVVMLTVCSRHR
jgi:hypothetical protein